ncbi:MAG: dicarboxylate/amino acid:cation symporter [Planctomycetes bacterium]|nr:dicarboxylate/amino acid:cation symporter [Planctomycetota bacterium]
MATPRRNAGFNPRYIRFASSPRSSKRDVPACRNSALGHGVDGEWSQSVPTNDVGTQNRYTRTPCVRSGELENRNRALSDIEPASSSAADSDRATRGLPLHTKILIGLLVGIVLGLAANWIGQIPIVPDVTHSSDLNANGLHDHVEWVATNLTEPAGKIFLRLMFMVVLPLVFSALSLAVAEIGDIRRLGRLGAKTLFYTAILSSTAVVLGVVLVNTIQPGKKLSAEKRDALEKQFESRAAASIENAKKAKPLRDLIVDLLPENPVQEMVGAIDGKSPGNGMLAVMVFSLLVGAAITIVPDRCSTLVAWLEGWNAISMVVIGWAMRLAPYGAGCLVFSITARLGFDILVTLLWFVLTVLAGLGLHLVVTYPLVLKLFSRMSPLQFFRAVREAMLVAFGTSSSNATLPTALKVAEQDLRLPKEVSRFVLTVGATGNQNGTALYEGVVVLFMAQVFGVELSLTQQVQVVLMSILAGVGTAGVPGGSLPLIVVLMTSVGVPPAGIGVIMGVDRLLDMCRTVLNVTGDLVVATCTAGGAEPQTE